MNTTRRIRSIVLGLFVGMAMMSTPTGLASAAPASSLDTSTYVAAGANGEDDDDSGWG